MSATINLKLPRDFFKDYARSRPCLIRIAAAAGYGGCAGEDTVVLAHPSIAGLKAVGSRKASVPDIGGAWACDTCHGLVDGRYKVRRASAFGDLDGATLKMVLQNAHLEGVIRTIDRLVHDGVLPNP